MTRLDDYRTMLSKLQEAQQCAYKCAYGSGCSTCLVRAPMNRAKELAQKLGESSIYSITNNIDNNYRAMPWKDISHDLTNAVNAAKPALRAAETQNAEDIRRAQAASQHATDLTAAEKQRMQAEAAAEAERQGNWGPSQVDTSGSAWWRAAKQSVADIVSGDPLRAAREGGYTEDPLKLARDATYAVTGRDKDIPTPGKCTMLDFPCHAKKHKWKLIIGSVGVLVLVIAVYGFAGGLARGMVS